MSHPSTGDRFSAERTFTDEEVLAFAALSRDRGRHHLKRDASGRLMVHGLLTASIPTSLGGDLHYIAREMVLEFVRPVYTGDAVRAELVVTKATPEPGRVRLEMDVICKNQRGQDVLRGRSHGVILDA